LFDYAYSVLRYKCFTLQQKSQTLLNLCTIKCLSLLMTKLHSYLKQLNISLMANWLDVFFVGLNFVN